MVNGKEEPCVCIPMKYAQMKRSRNGKPFITFFVKERPINSNGSTHALRLVYPNWDAVNAIRAMGQNKDKDMGTMRPHIEAKEKKVDRRNNMTPISCKGSICLSDIPEECIYTDRETGKKYINGNLLFKWLPYKDAFDNTHEIALSTGGGGELHLGYFRENPLETAQMRAKQAGITETDEPKKEDVTLPMQENSQVEEEDDDALYIGGFKF